MSREYVYIRLFKILMPLTNLGKQLQNQLAQTENATGQSVQVV